MNRIGVECGGTFTDLIVFSESGELLATNKVFSTPSDPSEAVVTGLKELDPAMLAGATLYHGSTVATNALIERKGALVGFLTTAGFEDVPFIQRQDREEMYNLNILVPEPLTSREYIRGIVERVSAQGEIRTSVDEAQVRQMVSELLELGVESFAVSLLHAYANRANEDTVVRVIRELAPEIPISQSSDISAEFREFERSSTTIADAFLKPRIAHYLGRLEEQVKPLGIAVMHVMLSNGGIVPAQTAADLPIAMLRSGPAAGVAGAISTADQMGLRDIVTIDMGGTSTDVAVVRSGEAEMAAQLRDGGLPINVAHVDIVAVGAGGGSLVKADSWGLLSVGPESAGADPGPISYGRGGTELAVTDINILREFLRPDNFLGGKRKLYPEQAEQRLGELAEQLGTDRSALLEDTFTLVNVNMAGAVRIATTERGIDPTQFDLFAYGGAGPLHAASVAEELGITRVVVPPNAGLASAFGLLAADFRREYAQTWFIESGQEADTPLTLEEPAAALLAQAKRDLEGYGLRFEDATISYVADMRYRGQGFEISVDMPDPASTVDEMAQHFNDYHEARYGHADRDRVVQIVTIRLITQVQNSAKAIASAKHADAPGTPETVTIFERGEKRDAVFIDRGQLAIGQTLQGPAIVSEPTSTTFVPSGWLLEVDSNTNLVLDRVQKENA